ncbi:penicillin-binding protein [Prosthecomicrobium hirschii]|uniref:penicillin-binding protein 1A n=1 Tax=Prosthecodimorpha hirschii TaxID=665126 RepID=UPI0011276CF7|nr:penicillin-binding protein 1A [Prosthecomicrobium hirschii]TPQ52080.1 penicillin-binding protein [Prosthecomicrobium hirschii]
MFIFRFFGWLFGLGAVVTLMVAGALVLAYRYVASDLPDYAGLRNYEPPVMTRVHASDGSLIAEYAHERRLFLPSQAIPQLLKSAFISAEDKNFYEHRGVDPEGIARAVYTLVSDRLRGGKKRAQGASTITQQVAKNFLLTNEQSVERKAKEAILAMRIEEAFNKEQILELYLNEIYLGIGAYGVAAASLLYFDKSVHELTIAECAYLAALPKAPNNYHPFRFPERAVGRRNDIIDLMAQNGYIKREEADKAKKEPLTVVPRQTGPHLFASDYFAEEVRRELAERYGEKGLYQGGLSVRTTLDPKMQVIARKVLLKGLMDYDQDQGWRGPLSKIDLAGGDWGPRLAEVKTLADMPEWRAAVVLSVVDQEAIIGLQPPKLFGGSVSTQRERGFIAADQLKWAKWADGPRKGQAIKSAAQVLQPGDVILVEKAGTGSGDRQGYRLRQFPEVSGALVAMDPHTGRVLAVAGGASFSDSEFNRATQAWRQPGSSFKPFVYSAALDNGYTPSSVVLDGPIEISQGVGAAPWRPENYSGKFYGPSTLRVGIEQSRNTMTVRLAKDMGMPLVVEYAKRFGIYDELSPVLSMSLGAGETTVLRMTAAYATIANGGRRVKATFIDRIQDRYGKTIYKHDPRICQGCEASAWAAQDEPKLIDDREQVLDPMTAYQITSMMEGVVQRGTATVLREVGKPVAGKTGTTNDEKDVWFMGFTPDLVVGVYVGYDKPRPLGRGQSGGHTAAPIAKDFFVEALREKPAVPFRVPPGIRLIAINRKSGLKASPGDPETIMEAFKPGTAPPDNYSIIGYEQGEFSRARRVTPEQERGLQPGGLY